MSDTPSDNATNARVPLLAWLGHHSATSYLLIAALIAPTGFVLETTLGDVLFVSGMVLAVALYLAAGRHEGGRCRLCKAEVPLIGADQAQRHDSALRRAHKGGMKRWLAPLFIAAGVELFVHLPAWLGPLTLSTLYLGIGLNVRATSKHAILFPWCQYCNDSGGGGFDDSALDPIPDPTPSARA